METKETTDRPWSLPQAHLLAKTLRAMAHPIRLSIIYLLEEGNRKTVTELYTELDSDQSAISHHLSIMKDRGILASEREGKYSYYFLANTELLHILDYLQGIHKEERYALT